MENWAVVNFFSLSLSLSNTTTKNKLGAGHVTVDVTDWLTQGPDFILKVVHSCAGL